MGSFIFTYRGSLMLLCLLPALLWPDAACTAGNYCIGIILFLIGLLLRILAVRHMGTRGRVHAAGARQLVTSGIYSHLRSPLYLGNSCIAAGSAALFCALASVPVVLLLVLGLYTMISRFEERSLEKKFGNRYLEYKKQVPLWFYRLRRFDSGSAKIPAISWPAVINYEISSLFMCVALLSYAYIWNSHLDSLVHATVPPEIDLLVDCSIVLFLVAVKFSRLAVRLQRKYGSWLVLKEI